MTEHPDLKGSITSEDVLGKDVIDSRGALLGVSDKLYLHPKTLKVVAISVDKGFLKTGLIIAAEFIREITSHAVFLTIEPAFRIKGMTVFDNRGAKIGKVKDVRLVPRSNSIQEIVVSTSLVGLANQVIPASHLARVENNVFLNISKSELK